MFLDTLTPSEKAAFLGLAKHMAQADGVVKDQEATLLRKMAAEMDIELTTEPLAPVDKLTAAFDSRTSRLIAMIELLALGYADQAYDPKEVALAATIAERFDIGPALIAEMDALVQAHIDVARRTYELFLNNA